MASRHSHAPTNDSRLSMSCGFRGAGPSIRNPLQAAKQRSCGYVRYLHLNTVPRRGTDDLLWKAAWLRRDAIASYVCFVCCVNSCLAMRRLSYSIPGMMPPRSAISCSFVTPSRRTMKMVSSPAMVPRMSSMLLLSML